MTSDQLTPEDRELVQMVWLRQWQARRFQTGVRRKGDNREGIRRHACRWGYVAPRPKPTRERE